MFSHQQRQRLHKTTIQSQVQLVDTTCDMFSHQHSKGNTRQLDSHEYSWWTQHVTCSHTNNGKGNTRLLYSHKYSWWTQHTTCSHTNNGKGNTRQLYSHEYSWWIQHVTCSHTNNGKGSAQEYSVKAAILFTELHNQHMHVCRPDN